MRDPASATISGRHSALSWRGFLRSEAAAIGPMTALLMVPIAGAIAFGVEMGSWLYVQRSMQNAADSAALAAATNNSATGSTYINEARAAARPFGFVDGQNAATVNAAIVTCPAGINPVATCYEATIDALFPLSFSRVVGFTGTDGSNQRITAVAVAYSEGGGATKADICVLALSSTGVPFQSNGGPKPDMEGCTIMSNGDMTCNGHDLGATYGISAGTNNGCGETKLSDATPITDPYAGKAANIPANPCSTYPQMAKVSGKWTIPAANKPTNELAAGTPAWAGTQKTFCGDIQLAGDVTLTGESTIVIYNGRLDLNGKKISTASGAAATIVFAGNNNSTYHHYPSSLNGGGTIDIRAPNNVSMSVWKGVAIYTDPALTTNVSFTYTGNDPTWNITGLTYFPKADLTFSGAVNKSATGAACFVLVSYTVLVNGTANIFANNTECSSAGLSPPSATVGNARPKLIL